VLFRSQTFVGTINGTVTWVPGNFNAPALSFNGTTGYLSCGTGFANFLKTNPFSGVAWVKTNISANSQVIVSKFNSGGGGGGQPGWEFGTISPNANIFFGIVNGAGTSYRSQQGGTNIADGKWHQVVFTYDGSNTAAGINLYVDGRAETLTLGSDTDPGALADTDFEIGRRQDTGTSFLFWNGLIDHVWIWKRALTVNEVALLYQQPFSMLFVPSYTLAAKLNQIWPYYDNELTGNLPGLGMSA